MCPYSDGAGATLRAIVEAMVHHLTVDGPEGPNVAYAQLEAPGDCNLSDNRDYVIEIPEVERGQGDQSPCKAILGMVSESPGRNASEPTGGPDKIITSEVEISTVE